MIRCHRSNRAKIAIEEKKTVEKYLKAASTHSLQSPKSRPVTDCLGAIRESIDLSAIYLLGGSQKRGGKKKKLCDTGRSRLEAPHRPLQLGAMWGRGWKWGEAPLVFGV